MGGWLLAGLLLAAPSAFGEHVYGASFGPISPSASYEEEFDAHRTETASTEQLAALHERGVSDGEAQAASGRSPARRGRARHAFPALVGNYTFLAGAQRKTKLAGMHIQMFDVAVYLDKNSELWQHKDADATDFVAHAPGQTLLRLRVTNGMVNGKRLAASMNKQLRGRLSANSSADARAMDEFVNLISSAQNISIGSVVDFVMAKGGVEVVVDGQGLGDVASPRVAAALLDSFIGEGSHLPGLKDDIFRGLHKGWHGPQRASEEMQLRSVRAQVGSTAKICIAVFAVVGFLAFLCLGLLLWHCRRAVAAKK